MKATQGESADHFQTLTERRWGRFLGPEDPAAPAVFESLEYDLETEPTLAIRLAELGPGS